MRSWVVGYPDMRLTTEQLKKKYGRYNYKRLGEAWPTYPEFRGLEVGLWLQAEQRHRNSTLVTKDEARRREWAKNWAASREAVRRIYMSRAAYKEVHRGSNYGRAVETLDGRRFIGISEPEEQWTARWVTDGSWEPQANLFVSTGQKLDLGLREQRGLDKMKDLRNEGNKPVLYLDAEATEAYVKG